MKASLALISLVFLLFSCIPQKEVYSDYSFNSDFNTYQTFSFVSNHYELGNPDQELVPYFEKYIRQRMEAQGYRFTDKQPDLLINYRFYADDFNLQASHQPKINKWVKESCNPELMEDGYELHEQKLRKGAVLISFYDNQSQKHVWQGYSTGQLSNKKEIDLRYLKASVNQIFNEYQLLANGYLASARKD